MARVDTYIRNQRTQTGELIRWMHQLRANRQEYDKRGGGAWLPPSNDPFWTEAGFTQQQFMDAITAAATVYDDPNVLAALDALFASLQQRAFAGQL